MIHEEYYEYSLSLLSDIRQIAQDVASSISESNNSQRDSLPGFEPEPVGSNKQNSTGPVGVSYAGVDEIAKQVSSGNPETYKSFGEMMKVISGSITSLDSESISNLSDVSRELKSLSDILGFVSPIMLYGGYSINMMANSIRNLGHSLVLFGPLALLATPILAITLPILKYMVIPMIRSIESIVNSITGFNPTAIKSGVRVLRVIGFNLFMFSGFLGLSSAILKNVNYPAVGMGILTIGAVGLAYAGLGLMDDSIKKGAFAIGLASLSMLVTAPALYLLSASISSNPNMIWQIPLALGGIGAVYALAGVGMPYILAGALAMTAVGASLWVIGSAIKKFAEIPRLEDATHIGMVIESVISGMARGIRSVTLKDAVTIPLKIPSILLMSAALVSLSGAVKEYQKNDIHWSIEDSLSLERAVGSMAKSFAIAGSAEGSSRILGIKIGRSDIERGVRTSAMMGSALNGITEGILKWNSMNIDDNDMRIIADNIGRVLNVIPGSFAVIGARERGSRESLNLFGISLPGLFGRGDVQLGIDATRNIGGTLKDMYDGVAAWKTATITEADVQLIANNVSKVLNTIPAIFASIGEMERGTRGEISFFGIKFALPFSKGDVELGIKSVRDLGDVLTGLYEGISAWGSPDSGITPEVIDSIHGNIHRFLMSIPVSFAKVGKMESDTEGLIFGKGDVNKGIDIIQSLTPTLQDITSIITSISESGVDMNILPSLGDSIVMLTSKLSTEGESLDDIIDPFEKFVAAFGKFTDFHVKYMKSVNDTDEDKIEANIGWLSSIKELGELNPTILSSNVGSLTKAYNAGYLVTGESGTGLSALANRFPIMNPGGTTYGFERDRPNQVTNITNNNDQTTNSQTADGGMSEEQKQMWMQMFNMFDQRLMDVTNKMVELITHMKTGVTKVTDVDSDNLFG